MHREGILDKCLAEVHINSRSVLATQSLRETRKLAHDRGSPLDACSLLGSEAKEIVGARHLVLHELQGELDTGTAGSGLVVTGGAVVLDGDLSGQREHKVNEMLAKKMRDLDNIANNNEPNVLREPYMSEIRDSECRMKVPVSFFLGPR